MKHLVFILLPCSIFIGSFLACKTVDKLAPEHGISEIKLQNGMTLFVKRQVRGLSYDELAISQNSARCTPASETTDYRFAGQGPQPLFYSVSGDTITVFNNGPLKKPRQDFSGVKVVVKVLDPQAYNLMTANLAQNGITKLEVPVSKCP